MLKSRDNKQRFNLSSHFYFIQHDSNLLRPSGNLLLPAHDLLSGASSELLPTEWIMFFHQHQQHQIVWRYLPYEPGKAGMKEEEIKIESSSELKPSHCALTLWTQMYDGGEDPFWLMKLIMRNHSSSMKSNDERADSHMCTRTVQYRDGQNNMNPATNWKVPGIAALYIRVCSLTHKQM